MPEDSLYCRLQTRLEVACNLQQARDLGGTMDTLLSALPDLPADQGPAWRRLASEYHYTIGLAALYAGDEDRTVDHLALADSLLGGLDGPGSQLRARIRRARGSAAYFFQENPFQAQDWYESAYREWQQAPQKDSTELAVVLQCMGQAAGKLGEYDKSVSLYQMSLEIRERLYGPRHGKVGWAYWNIGNTQFYAERYDSARVAYEKALAILEEATPDDQETIGFITTNLALCYDWLGLYDLAIAQHEESIRIISQSEGKDSPNLIYSYANLVLALGRNGSFAAGNAAIEQAYRICKASGITEGSLIARIRGCHSELLKMESGASERALAMAQSALAAIAPSTQTTDPTSYPRASETQDPQLMEQLVLQKSDLLLEIALRSGNDPRYLRASQDGFRLVAAIQERLRFEFDDQDDKLQLGGRGSSYLDQALHATALLHAIEGREEDLERALEFMEQNKFKVLLEFFRRSRMDVDSPIEGEDYQEFDSLRRACAALDYKLSLPGTHADTASLLRGTLLQNRLLMRKLQDSLESASPLFRAMSREGSSLSLLDLQQQLTDSSLMVAYACSDSNLYVLSLSKHKGQLRSLRFEGLRDTVRAWRQLCLQPAVDVREVESFGRIGHSLYNALLSPELAANPHCHQLVIVPDGTLGQVPFEALCTQPCAPGVRNFASLDYLIRSHRVSYGASATLWHDQALLPTPSQPLRCLGLAFGNEAVEDSLPGLRGRLRGLEGTEEEIAGIRERLDGTFLSGSEASEARFKALAPQFGILHLALHARASEADPQILFPTAGDADEDGILHFHELFPLKLQSRLAVLSACETGTGRLRDGEGIHSMSSGFAAAGVPSLIMSLWEVSDEAGSVIMQGFYGGLEEGLPIDEALRRAKIAYLDAATGHEAAPFYWSAYVPMGNMAPMKLARPIDHWYGWRWIFVGALCMFVGFCIHYWRRKRQSQTLRQ